jgi:hypothetical protein
MEGGTCWLTLNKPDRALATFAEAGDTWPEASRRDHGLFLARLAIAYTANGDLDQACVIGQQALALVKVTASARTLMQLRHLRQLLRPWRRNPAASRLMRGIASLMGDAP